MAPPPRCDSVVSSSRILWERCSVEAALTGYLIAAGAVGRSRTSPPGGGS